MNLQVGDVVTYKFIDKEQKGLITAQLSYTKACLVLVHNGDTILMTNDRLTKTGEHIDISSILERLKGDEE